MPARDPWQTRPKIRALLAPPRVRVCVFVRCVRSYAAQGTVHFAESPRSGGCISVKVATASGAPPLHVDAHAAWIQTGPAARPRRYWRIFVPVPRIDSGIHVAFLIAWRQGSRTDPRPGARSTASRSRASEERSHGLRLHSIQSRRG